MSAITYQDLVEIAGLNSDGVAGFEAQVEFRKDRIEAVWPEHLVGARVDNFRAGSELARQWLHIRGATGRARRKVRAQERKVHGAMNVYKASSAAELREEQLETLRQVVRVRDRSREPEAEEPSGPSI